MMNLQSWELVFKLSDFCDVSINGFFVDIPLLVYLLDYEEGISIDE